MAVCSAFQPAILTRLSATSVRSRHKYYCACRCFDIDPRGLAGDEEARAQAQLHEVFADPMFRDTPLSQAELKDWRPPARLPLMRWRASIRPIRKAARQPPCWPNASPATRMRKPRSPACAGRSARLYQSAGQSSARWMWRPESAYAEAVESDEIFGFLRTLQTNHQISTRIAPVEVMNTLRRLTAPADDFSVGTSTNPGGRFNWPISWLILSKCPRSKTSSGHRGWKMTMRALWRVFRWRITSPPPC